MCNHTRRCQNRPDEPRPAAEPGGEWPARTRSVSWVAGAVVVESDDDFDEQDLYLVRHRFPNRHVTLDGDVITVWPASRPGPGQ
ncbi:hypothetical protein ACWCP6_28455 [Streptomyces sp. NPDC002004]